MHSPTLYSSALGSEVSLSTVALLIKGRLTPVLPLAAAQKYLSFIKRPHRIPQDLLTHMTNIYFITQCSIEYYLCKEPALVCLLAMASENATHVRETAKKQP
jgi:hypothetical protein